MALHRGGLVKLLREPFLHFLVIGAAIFAAYGLTGGEGEDAAPPQIVVTVGDVEGLAARWLKQWQRPPSPEELQGLIDEHVREQVLYREALALGLDRDDTVVRRRLVQKFEFLTEDLAAMREPTPDELEAYFQAHRERYEAPPRVSFTQVYFSPDRRGDSAAFDARITLAALRTGEADGSDANLGDRVLLETRYWRQTPQEIAASFGREFARAVEALKPGAWSGPIASSYGLHLVRIEEKSPPRVPALTEVEAQVRADWTYDQRRQANEDIFRRLLAHYTVVIEGDATSATAVSSPAAAEREAR